MQAQYKPGDILQLYNETHSYTLRYCFEYQGKACWLQECTTRYYSLSVEKFRTIWREFASDVEFQNALDNIEARGNEASFEYECFYAGNYTLIGYDLGLGVHEMIGEEDRGGLQYL